MLRMGADSSTGIPHSRRRFLMWIEHTSPCGGKQSPDSRTEGPAKATVLAHLWTFIRCTFTRCICSPVVYCGTGARRIYCGFGDSMAYVDEFDPMAPQREAALFYGLFLRG